MKRLLHIAALGLALYAAAFAGAQYGYRVGRAAERLDATQRDLGDFIRRRYPKDP